MDTVAVLTVDLETTGIDVETAQPVQAAGTVTIFEDHLANNETEVFFSSFCKPDIEIEEGASEVHGIYKKDVHLAPHPEVAVSNLGLVVTDASHQVDVILCTYNGTVYDLPILNRFDDRFDNFQHIDVMSLAMRHLSEYGGKLTEVYAGYIGKEPVDAHDAAVDCLMTAEILVKYCKESGKTPFELVDELKIPCAYKVFPFGKHGGKPIAEVPKPYAKWCLKNFERISPDLEMTLKTILKRKG